MSTIDRLLSAAQTRLAELDGESEHLRALVRLYSGGAREQNTPQAFPRQETKGRGRGISAAWKPLGAHLAAHGELHLNDLTAFSSEHGLGFDRVQIRNQFHNWKRRGFVESPRQSVFAITQAGAEEMAAGEDSNGADDKTAPSPSFENGDEPQSASNARSEPVEP